MASLFTGFESPRLFHVVNFRGKSMFNNSQECRESPSDLIREWDRIPAEYVRASVDSFVGRLKKCIKAKGDVFEW